MNRSKRQAQEILQTVNSNYDPRERQSRFWLLSRLEGRADVGKSFAAKLFELIKTGQINHGITTKELLRKLYSRNTIPELRALAAQKSKKASFGKDVRKICVFLNIHVLPIDETIEEVFENWQTAPMPREALDEFGIEHVVGGMYSDNKCYGYLICKDGISAELYHRFSDLGTRSLSKGLDAKKEMDDYITRSLPRPPLRSITGGGNRP